MKQADMEVFEKTATTGDLWETAQYKPVAAPLDEMKTAEEQYKEEIFQYLRRKRRADLKRKEERVDRSKKMLVRFKGGGYIKAEKTWKKNGQIIIQYDRTLIAGIPKDRVASVTMNAVTWKEPVPRGQVRLKPARGITITLSRESARRISIRRSARYET